MASKISGQTMYLSIAPYKVDGCKDEFNELSVTVNYDDRRKHFYVAIHAGWKSSWGGHGCIILGGDDPLTAPKYVAVKDSPKNSRKTIEQMFANLELAKDGIAWLFDRRDWTRLYAAVKNIALYGYTEQFCGQMEALMKSPTPDPSPKERGNETIDKNNNTSNSSTMKLNLSNKNNETKNAAEQQVNNNEPIVRQVDVMGLMGALNRDGHAKLSDHVIKDADAEEVKDEQEEEIQSVAVGEVTLASIMPVMQPINDNDNKPAAPTKQEVASAIGKAAATGEATAMPIGQHGTLVIAGGGGEKPKKPVMLKKKQTEATPETKSARYFVQLLEAKSGGLWPKLYGFKDEKSAKAMAEKMPSSVNAKWDYGVNGEGRETKTRHWHLTAGKRYCDVMQELADALNKGDRVAVANAAAKACGVYAGVVAENTRIRQAMAA